MRVAPARAAALLPGLQAPGSAPRRAAATGATPVGSSLFGGVDPRLFLHVLRVQAEAMCVLAGMTAPVWPEEEGEPTAALPPLAAGVPAPGSVAAAANDDNDDGDDNNDDREEEEEVVLPVRRSKRRRLEE